MRMPNLNSLRVFDASARHLNFRLAAEELNVTHGAVAQQVRRLETDLGSPLFLRRPRGLELTMQGRQFHQDVRRAMAIIEDATGRFAVSKTVILSMPPSFAAKWLVPRLRGFEDTHPEIKLEIRAETELVDLERDDVDFAIRQGSPPFPAHMDSTCLARLDLTAVASQSYSSRIGALVEEADLFHFNLIQDGHRHWEQNPLAHSARPRILQFNQTALAIDAARNGQGIALVPKIYLQGADAEQLDVIWNFAETDMSGFFLLRLLSRTQNAAQRAVADWLISQFDA